MTPVSIESLLQHRSWVRAIARGLVSDESSVDDLEQETWLRALKRPPQAGGIRAWLRRVVRRLAIDRHRRDTTRTRREQTAGRAEPPSPPDLLEHAELQRTVADLVVRLDEPYRAVVLLRFFEGLPPRAIAARLRLPVETVRTRLKRALQMMRGRLDADRGEWRTGMLAIAGVPLARTVTGGIVVGSTAKKTVTVAAVIALLLGAALWHYSRGDRTETTARTETGRNGSAATTADEPAASNEGPAVRSWRARGRVVVGPKELPLAGARVRAEMFTGYTTDGDPVRTDDILTDEAGNATWEPAIPQGTVTLRFTCEHEGHSKSSDRVLVVRGEEPAPFEIQVYALDRIVTGHVTDEKGVAVAGARVWTRGEKATAAATNQYGRYRILAANPGFDAYLYASAEGYAGTRTIAKLAPAGLETTVDIQLRHEFVIVGAVRDEDGRPVAGAVVTTFFASQFTKAHTDANGTYRLGRLDPGRANHSLYARKAGYVETHTNVRTEGTQLRQDLILKRGHRVEGIVFDPDGKPAAGARVSIGFSRFAYDRLDVVSDDDGAFLFPAVATGKQTLRTYKRGAAPHQQDFELPGTDRIEVRLERAHVAAGIIRTADGKPLRDAHVAVRLGRESLPLRAVTDAEGRFELGDLPGEPVELILFAQGYVRQEHRVEVDRTDLAYTLERAATLAGRVVDGSTGQPIDTFTIRFSSASHNDKHVGYSATWAREGHRFSDTNGYWACTDEEFPPGTMVGVEAHAAGYAPTRHVAVTAAVDPDRDGSIIKLFRGAELKGVIVDPAGRPVAGATVKLAPGDTGVWNETHDLTVTRAGPDGRFLFENVAPGEYSIYADHKRFAPAFKRAVRVGRGEPPEEQRVAFSEPGRIHGVAPTGAKVTLSGHRGRLSRHAIADANGRFAFENLGDGEYSVSWHLFMNRSFSITGFGRTVNLKAPAAVEVSLVPAGTAHIEGTVEGAPAGGSVSLAPLEPGPPIRGALTKDGAFVFERVEPGRYLVNYFHYETRRFARADVTIADGETKSVKLTVPSEKR